MVVVTWPVHKQAPLEKLRNQSSNSNLFLGDLQRKPSQSADEDSWPEARARYLKAASQRAVEAWRLRVGRITPSDADAILFSVRAVRANACANACTVRATGFQLNSVQQNGALRFLPCAASCVYV